MSSASLLPSEIKDSIKEQFYQSHSLNEFSDVLNRVETEIIYSNRNFSAKPISQKHLLYLSKNSNEKYQESDIPKKSGGYRRIEAPDSFLKRIQTSINVLFQILFSEKYSYYSNGFVPKRNIVRNATFHTNKRFVLNLDIENFFPSISFRRVKTVLQLEPFHLTEDKDFIGFVVANICCLNGHLPQGAPTSPLLSNMVTQRLDRKLVKLSSKLRIKYSRYADDISFSSNRNIFKNEVLSEIREIIKSEGFEVNDTKTRIKSNRDHQEVTGIVVNEKINVRRKYLKTVRTMLHNWEFSGLEHATNEFNRCELGSSNKNFISVLGGRIGHIGFVRGKNDSLFQKLNMRYSLLRHGIDYSRIPDLNVKRRLIRDNQKMEKILLDSIHDDGGQFISFCTSAFHQIENLTNYYYWKRFPKMNDLLMFLLENNPAFKKRYRDIEQCKRFKRIRDLDINVLIYLVEKEFYFDRKVSYRQELTMLRDIRNDDSHRCEIDQIDQNATIHKYNKLKLRWDRHKERTGRYTQKNEAEQKIEYDYRLIQFVKEKKYNTVRKILHKLSGQIQQSIEDLNSNSQHQTA